MLCTTFEGESLDDERHNPKLSDVAYEQGFLRPGRLLP
jgi:hypothetical protein